MNKRMKSLSITIAICFSLILIQSCKKDGCTDPTATNYDPKAKNDDGSCIGGTGGTGATTSAFFAKFKVDGIDVSYEGELNNGLTPSLEIVGNGSQASQGTIAGEILTFKNTINLELIEVFPYGEAYPDSIDNMLQIKSYGYGLESSNGGVNGIDGAVVAYIDGAGTEWRSDNAPATQSGSTFVITKKEAGTDGTTVWIATGTFNCKVYDSSGNSKTITAGSFRGKFITY